MNLLVALVGLAWSAPVQIEVNDSLVKDERLPEVEVLGTTTPGGPPQPLGATGSDGLLAVDLAPDDWYLSYRKPGYVPIAGNHVHVPPAGLHLTATLSMLLEAQGVQGRRVQIVLNWGNDPRDVPDADSHLVVAATGEEVYFGNRSLAHPSVSLDVDDVDWGGPETITLIDPPPGRYHYYVREFVGPMTTLGSSDVRVRVIVDDHVEAELAVPADLSDQDWFPFKALVVDDNGQASIEPWTPEQLAAGQDRRSSRLGLGTLLCIGALCVIGGLIVAGALRAFLRRS